jgi:hypothetical protein
MVFAMMAVVFAMVFAVMFSMMAVMLAMMAHRHVPAGFRRIGDWLHGRGRRSGRRLCRRHGGRRWAAGGGTAAGGVVGAGCVAVCAAAVPPRTRNGGRVGQCLEASCLFPLSWILSPTHKSFSAVLE